MKHILILFVLISVIIAQTKLEEANKLILKNKYSEAAIILNEYVNINQDSEAYLKLGICYKNLMKNNEALQSFEKANELDPNNVEILINLAQLYSIIGFLDKSTSTYEQIISLDSLNSFALINLAKSYLDANRIYDAKKIYYALFFGDSLNSYYHRQLAYTFQKENKIDTALYHYKRSFKLNNADIFTVSNLAKIYYQKELPDSAIALIDKGLEVFHNNTQLLKLKSDIYFSLRNYSGAVNAIVRLIANGDESAQLYQRLGICYYQIAVENFVGEAQEQKLESAIEALNKSTAMDSTQSLTELYLGMTLKELERNKDALIHFGKSLDLIYPKYTSAIYTNMAIANNRIGNHAEAIRNFKSAMKFDKSNPNYFYYLASTYDQYYSDKTVPLLYYQLFVEQGDSLEQSILNYARKRIEELKEKVHFQNGSANKLSGL